MAYSLQIGSTGLDVYKLQYYINQILGQPNLKPMKEDGIYGQETSLAVAIFQYVYGLPVDGVVGTATWNRIIEEFKKITNPSTESGTSRILSVGSRGLGVEKVQTYLNELISPIPRLMVDGVYGNATRQAVASFQARNNLKADGIVGSITWNQIIRQL